MMSLGITTGRGEKAKAAAKAVAAAAAVAKAGEMPKVKKAATKKAAAKKGVIRDIRRVAKVAATSSSWYDEQQNAARDPHTKQSGVPDITWLDTKGGVWKVSYKDEETKRPTNRWFPLKKFLDDNYSQNEADAAALQEALAFREELASKGILEPIFHSRKVGVVWNRNNKSWRARYALNGNHLEKHFYPKDNSPEEMKRSQQEAEAQRKEWEKLYGITRPGRPGPSSTARPAPGTLMP